MHFQSNSNKNWPWTMNRVSMQEIDETNEQSGERLPVAADGGQGAVSVYVTDQLTTAGPL